MDDNRDVPGTARAESTDQHDSVDELDGRDSAEAPGGDPRLESRYVRRVPPFGSNAAPITLVGVVHDHPASVHRVRSIVESESPAVLALEIPPIALPLFEEYAADERAPPAFGGEVSAAIQAADCRAVGIDGPSRRFFRSLLETCWHERPSPSTLRRFLAGVASVCEHALRCRLAATVAHRAGVRLEVDDPVIHDCDHADDPATQAAHEARQVRASTTLLRALDAPHDDLRDRTREACMAAELRRLRAEGDGSVVAVVGIGHLDALFERLAN